MKLWLYHVLEAALWVIGFILIYVLTGLLLLAIKGGHWWLLPFVPIPVILGIGTAIWTFER